MSCKNCFLNIPYAFLLKKDPKTGEWIENCDLKEIEKMIEFLWKKGFVKERNYKGDAVYVYTTKGGGLKLMAIKDLLEKSISHTYVWGIVLEKVEGSLQGQIVIANNLLIFLTKIDLSPFKILLKECKIKELQEATKKLRGQFSKIVKELKLKWDEGEIGEPIVYKNCEINLTSLKEFIEAIEKLSEKFPIYWE